MNFITPEQAGISSRHVLDFYKELEERHLSTHAVILSRGNDFFSECYYAPFHKDFLHRMYSTSKSFVSVAIGFCEQEGLLSLDDPLIKFFPEHQSKPYPYTTSIRDMLQMTTDCPCPPAWFYSGTQDRTAYYFEHPPTKQAGTLFRYDSAGSFMLGAVVERVTGLPLLDYLRQKVLNDIGFSKEATCLLCPGGHAWGDSGILCTARDLWLFARFVLNGGSWEGKQYLNADYLKTATSPLTPNSAFGFGTMSDIYGYGYQFWCLPQGCYSTLGMGNQIAFCDPVHDFILVMNADNQGNPNNYDQIFSALYRHVVRHLGEPMAEDAAAHAELCAYTASQKLFSLYGPTTSPFMAQINGRTFLCEEGPTGIRRFRLEFADGEGVFHYENATGEKAFRFGLGHNVFGKFPESGYADLVGAVAAPGNRYDAAFSADFPAERFLRVRVQIIDKYFANLGILFAFRDENTVSVEFVKKAEAFLDDYKGIVNAHAEPCAR